MRYRVKKGVVLFAMLGKDYLFPSRESGVKLGMLIALPEELAALLRTGGDPQGLGKEMLEKLHRYEKLGFVEECP